MKFVLVEEKEGLSEAHILDTIRYGGETKDKMETLCSDYKYSPTDIGIAILKSLGYYVDEYPNGSVFVRDKGGKNDKLLFYSVGSDED